MKSHQAIAVLPGLLALSGCLSLAPDYQRPPAPVPDTLPVSASSSEAVTPLRWNDLVVSESLRNLIVLALAENRDLQATAANVRAAKARLVAARGDLFPSVDASLSSREA